MATDREYSLLLGFLVLLCSLAPTMSMTFVNCSVPKDPHFTRKVFPSDFVFGTGSSAYQYEGHYNKNGKGPSIWDVFTHDYPGRISDHSTGDVAIDFYDRYKEDIKRMKNMKMDAFRFSISWPRLIPSGQRQWGINREGICFYKQLIHDIKSNGMEPYVTLFHWDTPQSLYDKYGGFLSENIVNDFRNYADLCFQEFGHQVKYWFTLNEPQVYSDHGYDSDLNAPGRCSTWVNKACQAGNSASEPYTVTHNLLLAHSEAVKLYRQKYQGKQNGKIGITLNSFWYEPYNATDPADHEAVQRLFDFNLGWHLSPVTYGFYPRSMQKLVGDRLPSFTEQQMKDLKKSYDMVGINYYGAFYGKNFVNPNPDPTHLRYSTDSQANSTGFGPHGKIGPQAASPWLFVYPKGIRRLLNYMKDNYRNPIIYVTENGVSEFNNETTVPVKQALNDTCRIKYYHEHLKNVKGALNDNVIVKGFFVWTFADDFEWPNGYTIRFGLYYTDYLHNLKRHPKKSVDWFKNFLNVAKESMIIKILPFGFSTSASSDD